MESPSPVAKDVQTTQDPEEIKAQANGHYKQGAYAEAATLYTQAIDLAPQNPTYLANRAAAYLMLGKYHEATEDCRRAVTLDPGFTKAYLRAGKAHLALGNLSEASRNYRLALDYESNNTQAKADLGKINELVDLMGRVERAKRAEAWAEVVRLSLQLMAKAEGGPGGRIPVSWRLLRAEGLIGSRDWAMADQALREIIREDPKNADAVSMRGQVIYAETGDTEKAMAHWQEALRSDPEHARARVQLKKCRLLERKKAAGNAAFKTGKLQEACDLYTEALEVDPSNAAINSKIHSNRAMVFTKLKRYEEALEDCDAAIALDPDFIKAYRRRGETLLKLERYEEAVDAYKEAQERDPDASEVRRELKNAELELKKSKRKDHYKTLGVPKDAEEVVIKKAYRRLALQYHPDKNAGDEVAEARFKEIGEAYAILSDPEKRRRFDSGADLMAEEGGMGGMDPADLFNMFHGGGGGFPGGFPGGAGGFGGGGGFPGGGGGFGGGGFPGGHGFGGGGSHSFHFG